MTDYFFGFVSRFQRKTGENSVSLENQNKVGEYMIGGIEEDRAAASKAEGRTTASDMVLKRGWLTA